MALPKTKKKFIPDISSAVHRAAGTAESSAHTVHATSGNLQTNRGGRPSPRSGNTIRQTLLLSESVGERLTMAYAAEQIKRRKEGRKLDKSMFIEEMIIDWLNNNDY